MFNAYPDSIGKRLSDTVELLKRREFRDAFSLFYILPTFFNSDLDRGFSIIDYNINEEPVTPRRHRGTQQARHKDKPHQLHIAWQHPDVTLTLKANLRNYCFTIYQGNGRNKDVLMSFET